MYPACILLVVEKPPIYAYFDANKAAPGPYAFLTPYSYNSNRFPTAYFILAALVATNVE